MGVPIVKVSAIYLQFAYIVEYSRWARVGSANLQLNVL